MTDHRRQLIGAIEDQLRGVITVLTTRRPPGLPVDLTVSQFGCLRAIGHLGTPTMSELAATLGLHASTVTGLVDRLVARGLVRRLEDREDRRIVRVEHTPEGARNRNEALEAVRRRLGELTGELDDGELVRIREALDALSTAVARGVAREPRAAPDEELHDD
jgi:DNA-binding MarR family transcriptional regulator